jgi:hypothetical protein
MDEKGLTPLTSMLGLVADEVPHPAVSACTGLVCFWFVEADVTYSNIVAFCRIVITL